MTTFTDGPLEDQIAQWRAYVRRRQALHGPDVEELEGHLRDQVAAIEKKTKRYPSDLKNQHEAAAGSGAARSADRSEGTTWPLADHDPFWPPCATIASWLLG